MAGAAFPAWVHVIGDGYAGGQDIDVARTTFDDGFVQQVKRFTAAQETRALEIVIDSDAGYVRFRAWARARAHAWFAWTDPEDGVTREARVRGGAGGIEYRASVSGGVRSWEASLTLEGLWARTVEGA